MLPLIRFLDYFGGVTLAFGIIWLYALLRRDGQLTDILPVEVYQPGLASATVAVGVVMLLVARVLTAWVRVSLRRMQAGAQR